MRSGVFAGLTAALLVAAASPSQAAAPFDAEALMGRWPGADAVYLNRTIVFSMPDEDTLRVETHHRLAVLSDSVQEDLVLFSVSRRPGCREPKDIVIAVTNPQGDPVPWDGRVLELPSGNHPVDAERSSVMLSTSRRGLSSGALLDERWTVDYARACFDGLVGSERLVADVAWPIEHLLLDVPCAGNGCFAGLDMPFGAGLQPREGGGLRIEERDIPAPPPEFRVPDQGIPSIIVASSDDPLEVGRVLSARLTKEVERAGSVLDSHRAAADKAFPQVSKGAPRLARYLADGVARLEDGAFWQFGFDWGGPTPAGRRPLLPMEWWTLAAALLEEEGGIPLLLDTESHLAPPIIGRVVNYDRLGVLLPGRGVATDAGWFPTLGEASTSAELTESHADLAGLRAMLLGDRPELVRFPDLAGLETYVLSGTMTPTSGSTLVLDLTHTYRGASGAALRRMWQDRRARWATQPSAERGSESTEAREFAQEVLFGHEVGRTRITAPRDDGALFELSTGYSRGGLVQRSEEVVVVALPVDLHDELIWLVGPEAGRQRAADYALSLTDDEVELEVIAPRGTKLVGLPQPVDVSAGPVSLSVAWSETDKGARLQYRFVVGERLVPASHAKDLERVSEELRRLQRTRLLFVPE
ncbi:MAG: hypothetical protein KDA24_19910 [Deltaproteobacteria bacterium]|nr:hypothetical protein [Deltaproteobacteria bacterium]